LIRMIWFETFLIFHQRIIIQLQENTTYTRPDMKFSDRLLVKRDVYVFKLPYSVLLLLFINNLKPAFSSLHHLLLMNEA